MAAKAKLLGVRFTEASTSTAMPFVLARRWAQLRGTGATLVAPGGSTPVGVLGYVGAGLELVDQMDEPDEIVVALGSGGSAVGVALGIALGGWRHATVRAVRVADAIITNLPVLRALELGVRELLLVGGVLPPPAKLVVDTEWFGPGYGHETDA